jgi:hypothetical protein
VASMARAAVRGGVGSLLMGIPTQDGLHYVGRVVSVLQRPPA